MIQSLLEIRETFLNFQQTHVPTCTFIPTDIRQSYYKYMSDEKKYYDDVSDEFVWVSSAIHRGLRDLQCGVEGIVHLSELASPLNLKDVIPMILEYITHKQASEKIQPIQPNYNIQTRDLLETDILFQPGHTGHELIGHAGNHYWHQIISDLRPTYLCGKSAKTVTIRLIVKVSRHQKTPGRFLLQDQVSGLWNEIRDEDAEVKTYAMMENEVAGRSGGAILDVQGYREDTFDKAFEIAEAIKALNEESLSVDTTSVFNHHPQPTVNPSTIARPNSAVEEENEPTHQSKQKKQKLENSASVVVDSVPKPSRRVSLRRKTGVSDKLSTLIYCHDDEKLGLKNIKSSGSSSSYNGLKKGSTIMKGNRVTIFYSEILSFYLGPFVLESAAALAYDSVIRARALKEHYNKINFNTKEDYLEAREKEMKNRDIPHVDLERILDLIISAVEKATKQEEPESSPFEDTTSVSTFSVYENVYSVLQSSYHLLFYSSERNRNQAVVLLRRERLEMTC